MQKFLITTLLFLPFFTFSQLTTHRTQSDGGQKFGFYQFLPPSYSNDPASKSPLIIFLHGIGEKGTGYSPDIERLNCCGIPKYIAAGSDMEFEWNGKKEGFVVLYPQLASKYGTWENYYVDALIKYASENLNVDTDRVFLTGLSLGGGGTWVYASASLTNARKLAGIVPVVSPCFMSNGCNIANAKLPVLAVHALDDTMANPKCTINTLKSINDCGAIATPNAILYQTGGHYVWVRRAYDLNYKYFNPNVYEWMLAQNRKLPPNKKPVPVVKSNIVISSAVGRVNLDASASTDPDGKIVRYVWQKTGGPAYGLLRDDVTATPTLTGLTFPGVYTFQVRVIDDRAEWSTGIVKITVVDGNVLH